MTAKGTKYVCKDCPEPAVMVSCDDCGEVAPEKTGPLNYFLMDDHKHEHPDGTDHPASRRCRTHGEVESKR